MSSVILRLQIKTRASLDGKTIESFWRLGFAVKDMFDIETNPVIHVYNLSSGTSLNRESWSRLYSLLTSLSPISLSLSFNGLQEQDWTSPVSSLGTLFLANTYLQEIDEDHSTSIPLPKDANLAVVRKVLSQLSSAVGSARRKSQNHGS